MGNITYYYKRENGDWVFSLEDGTGIRRTIVKNEYAGDQYHRMLRYSKRNPQRLYLDLPEDYRTIKRFFFNEVYWAGKQWQDEYTRHDNLGFDCDNPVLHTR